MQGDGKVIAAGTAHDSGEYRFALARLEPNGTLTRPSDRAGRSAEASATMCHEATARVSFFRPMASWWSPAAIPLASR